MVGVTLGTGVGGVMAVDGHVSQGHDGTAGEFGHQTMEVDGCACTRAAIGAASRHSRARTRSPRMRYEHGRGSLGARARVTSGRRGARGGRPLSGHRHREHGRGPHPRRVVIGGGIAAAFDMCSNRPMAELRRARLRHCARLASRSCPRSSACGPARSARRFTAPRWRAGVTETSVAVSFSTIGSCPASSTSRRRR